MTEREQIIASLAPLFDRAERENLLFRAHYQQIVFTPGELQKEQADGRFVWGPVNWELISKDEYLRQAEVELKSAEAEVNRRRALTGAREQG